MPLEVTLRVAERADAPIVQRTLQFADGQDVHTFLRALAVAGRCVLHGVEVVPSEAQKLAAWRDAVERAAGEMEDAVVREGLRLVHAPELRQAAEVAGVEARGVKVDAAEALLVCDAASRVAVLAHLKEVVEEGAALQPERLAPPVAEEAQEEKRCKCVV